jgi:predicted neuraminidase
MTNRQGSEARRGIRGLGWIVAGTILLLLLSGIGLNGEEQTLAMAGQQSPAAETKPFHKAEMIFPLEHWHNHSSMVVEASNGELIVSWFHGSGERQADDVIIEGARWRPETQTWSSRFLMADTQGYPDTNCTLFIDPQDRLWLLWPTILANEWHTALMKYKISRHYQTEGPPTWESAEVLHVTPGEEFVEEVERVMKEWEAQIVQMPESQQARAKSHIESIRKQAADKLSRRLGWMTRAHPFLLDGQRLIVPLYSDGYSFSLMAISDDWGRTWKASRPLIGWGNIQPSIVRRKDGALYTLMRDNGPPPKRLQQSLSLDRGETWSPVTDSLLPNPGAGAEIINLQSGHWALIYNDTEVGRHRLAVAISEDEGATWPWKRYLEVDPPGPEAGSYHYPSLIQARDGSFHATYSFFDNRKVVPLDEAGKPRRKSIKHAHFNEAWVRAGDPTTGTQRSSQ